MSQRTPVDHDRTVPEPKFYVPAGTPTSSIATRFDRAWAALFNHRV